MGQYIVITPYGRTLVDDADAAAARTTLGLGTAAVQSATAFDAAGAAAAAQAASQPLDGDLTAISALSGTNTIYYRSGVSTWSPIVVGSGLDFTAGTLSATGGGGVATGDSPTWTGQHTYMTGTTGQVPVIFRQTGGTPGTHEIRVGHNGTNGVVQTGAGFVLLIGEYGIQVQPGIIRSINTNLQLQDSGGGVAGTFYLDHWKFGASQDTGIGNVGPGVIKVTNGSTGGGILECLQVASGGTPTTNSTRLYAKDVAGNAEMFVKDEAGTETQISPHSPRGPASLYDTSDPLPHVVEEYNDYLGGVRYLNVSRACMLIEELLKAIEQGRTLAQIRTTLTNKGPGFIDVYRTESYTAHNARLGLTGANAKIRRNWTTDQNAKQLHYDTARAAELTAYAAWELLPVETRGPAPVVRPVADIRKPIPQWLAARGVT